MKTFKISEIKNPLLSAAVLFFFTVTSGTPAFAAPLVSRQRQTNYQPAQQLRQPTIEELQWERIRLLRELWGKRNTFEQRSDYRVLNQALGQVTGASRTDRMNQAKTRADNALTLITYIENNWSGLSPSQKPQAKSLINKLKPRVKKYVSDLGKFLTKQETEINKKINTGTYYKRLTAAQTQLETVEVNNRLKLNAANNQAKNILKTTPPNRLPGHTVPPMPGEAGLLADLQKLIQYDSRIPFLNTQLSAAKTALREWEQILWHAQDQLNAFNRGYQASLQTALDALASKTSALALYMEGGSINFPFDPEADEFVRGDEAFQARAKMQIAAFLGTKRAEMTGVAEATVSAIREMIQQYYTVLQLLQNGEPVNSLPPAFQEPSLDPDYSVYGDPLAENGIIPARIAWADAILERLENLPPASPEEIYYSPYSNLEPYQGRSFYRVLNNRESYEKLWDEMDDSGDHWGNPVPPPRVDSIDFNTTSVFIYVDEVHSTGGYGLAFIGAQIVDGRVQVKVGRSSPEPGSITTDALTRPLIIATLPKGFPVDVEIIEAAVLAAGRPALNPEPVSVLSAGRPPVPVSIGVPLYHQKEGSAHFEVDIQNLPADEKAWVVVERTYPLPAFRDEVPMTRTPRSSHYAADINTANIPAGTYWYRIETRRLLPGGASKTTMTSDREYKMEVRDLEPQNPAPPVPPAAPANPGSPSQPSAPPASATPNFPNPASSAVIHVSPVVTMPAPVVPAVIQPVKRRPGAVKTAAPAAAKKGKRSSR